MRRKHTVANVLSAIYRERKRKITLKCKQREEEFDKKCCKKKRKTVQDVCFVKIYKDKQKERDRGNIEFCDVDKKRNKMIGGVKKEVNFIPFNT